MKPGIHSLTAALLVLFLIGLAAADDCGCGGFGDDGPGPSGGWDTHDDWDSSAGSRQDDSPADSSTDTAVDDTSDGSDSGPGSDTGYGDDSGSDPSSGSDISSSASGGSVEEAIVWRMKGDDLFGKGLYNESLAAYEKAISLDPYALKSWTGKGRALLAVGLPARAADAFERALHLDPGNAAVYVDLGDALAADGKYEEAVENFLKALAMNPKLSGVQERISGAEAAMAAALQSAGPIPEVTLPAAGETATETVTIPPETIPETTVVPGTPHAGIPGFPVVILALLVSMALLVMRRT